MFTRGEPESCRVLVFSRVSLLSFSPSPSPPHPSLQVTATDTTVKDLSTLNLEGAVETFLADDVVVGGTYNYNAGTSCREVSWVSFGGGVGRAG